MKSFVIACVVAIGIGVISFFVLSSIPDSSSMAYQTQGVRL
jgi:CHASE3 domain sensor protein